MTHFGKSAGKVPAIGMAWLAGALLLQSCIWDSESVRPGAGPDAYPYRGHYSISAPGPFNAVHLDSGLHVAWRSSPQDSGAKVSLQLQGESGFLILGSDVPDSGSFDFDLRGVPLPGGDRFRIKVVSSRDTGHWDFSGPFAIVPDAGGRLSFLEPAPGTVAKIDSTLAIRIPFPQGVGAQVKLELLKDWVPILEIQAGMLDTAPVRYGWHVDGNLAGSGDGYRIRASAYYDNEVLLGYSPAFTIESEYHGGFVVAGHSGDTVHAGSMDSVAWSSFGNPGLHFLEGLYLDGKLLYPLDSAAGPGGSTASATWRAPVSLPTSSRYRLGVRSASDAAIFSLSGEFTILGVEPDAFEPDDEITAARALVPGAPPQEKTLTYQEADWVRIRVEAGKRYGILLLDSGQASATFHGSAVGDETYVRGHRFHELDSLEPGDYHLEIRHFESAVFPWRSGRYRLYLHAWDAGADLPPVSFAAPAPGDTVREGDRHSVSWVPDTNLFGSSIRADLYLDTAWIQSLARSAPNTGSLDWMVGPGLASSSRYRIRIAREDVPELTAFSPRFTLLTSSSPDAYEPDGAKEEAGRIVVDADPQTRNLTASDTDWVAFDCRQGSSYSVRAESGFKLSLLAQVDRLTRHSVAGVSPEMVFQGQDGLCHLRITGTGVGEYRLTVRSQQP